MPSLVEIGPAVPEKKIVFLLFWYYLPLDKEVPIHLNKLESTSPKDAFIVQSLIEIGPVVLRKIFKCCQLEKGNALHLINLESLLPMSICSGNLKQKY